MLWWCAAAAALLLWRAVAALPRPAAALLARPRLRRRARVLVVLGSGGHTTEMFYDLATVSDWEAEYEATYLIADTDKKSADPAEAFEQKRGGRRAAIVRVPRAREVGQSYLSSVPTTLHALWVTVRAVLSLMPDAVVCNGPGTCVPAVAAAYLPRFFGVKRITVIYSESLACVEHLSLSGRILYRLADVFTVQWDPLYRACRPSGGRPLHAGRCRDGVAMPPLPVEEQGGDGTAIVTVGSTRFDALIRACDSEAVLRALADLGVRRMRVQKGNGEYQPTVLTGPAAAAAGIDVDVLTYSPAIPAEMRRASLVISHAGAGTVLDCLLHARRMLVVPNEGLMDNHQVQLAEELQKYGVLRWCRHGDLADGLRGYTGAGLRRFPAQPTPVFADALRRLCGK